MMLLVVGLQTVAEPVKLTAADAVRNPGAWIRQEDYPASALAAQEEGRTAFELQVDGQGSVRGCRITATSGSTGLDARTCALFWERARFKPGRAGMYASAVVWNIPVTNAGSDDLRQPIEITTAAFSFSVLETELIISEDGVVESCEVIESSSIPVIDPCAKSPVGAKGGAGQVRNGKPVKAIVRQRLTIETRFTD